MNMAEFDSKEQSRRAELVADCWLAARDLMFFGEPVERMTASELLAVVGYLQTQLNELNARVADDDFKYYYRSRQSFLGLSKQKEGDKDV